MNIESKKKDIINLISSIADEHIIDQIGAKIVKLVPKMVEDDLSKFKTEIVQKFDLEKLKQQQNYSSPSLSEIEKLIADADIKEPIEELLEMI